MRLAAAILFILGMALAGCSSGRDEVVVYAALDREFSEPILNDFSRATGVAVVAKYDVESTKTVGLTQAIMAETNRPRCDVFWNNEILNTIRLEEKGLLAVYRPPTAESYPEQFRSKNGTWHGFAGRARVLIVNTKIVPKNEMPKSIYDMADKKWKSKVGIAKPLFGTTATHAACLFAALGDDKAKEFFQSLKENEIKIQGGNKQVAVAVGSGQLAFGLTDTDDAIIELERGAPVVMVYPDREEKELGTLFIPNTLCIIKGAPHEARARNLVHFLLSAPVEGHLAEGPSAQIPLNPQVNIKSRVETPRTVHAMQVDFAAAVKKWDSAAKFIQDEFTAE
ncbi:MAG: extracellular solute-binding protein [Pirellulaceae bacterium]